MSLTNFEKKKQREAAILFLKRMQRVVDGFSVMAFPIILQVLNEVKDNVELSTNTLENLSTLIETYDKLNEIKNKYVSEILDEERVKEAVKNNVEISLDLLEPEDKELIISFSERLLSDLRSIL